MSIFSFFDYKAKLFLLDCILITVVVAMCAQTMNKVDIVTSVKDMLFITSFYSMMFIVCDIILRLSHLLVTLMDSNTQCDVDILSALQSRFGFNMAATILIIINTVLFIVLIVNVRGWPFSYIGGFSPLACIPCILLSWILLRITNFSNWDLQTASPINVMKGLDYGTGLAYSYYYGYLKIILPSTGTASKGLLEKIENIEDTHNITLASRKLMVLIPASSYIPPDLKEASYQWMESAVNLEEEQRDRAGVKGRSYRNNIYKIYPGGQKSGSTPLYIVAEGATPLLTFYEVQKNSHPETSIYKKYHKEITQKFYRKLKELLNDDPECRDLCELIYYKDYDSNGTKVNIAKIILQKLSNIQSTERDKGLN